MAFKTPGVYVKEISLFPPSVAEVATAIPAFIGYTEKAVKKGEGLTNKPTRISSLLEYQDLFGGAYGLGAIEVQVDNSYAVTSINIPKRFYLYDSLRLFFDNGGGNCYVVSVGRYSDSVQMPALRAGLKALEKFDEPTIILFPDAALLADENNLYTLQQLALAQCAKLQDRVAVFDLYEGDATREHTASVGKFRNGIGINNLKYGAAYTPWLVTTYPRSVDFGLFRDHVRDGSNATVNLANITSDSAMNALVSAANTALADQGTIAGTLTTLRSGSLTLKDRYKDLKDAVSAATDDTARTAAFRAVLVFLRGVAEGVAGWKSAVTGTNLTNDLATYAGSTLAPPLTKLIALERNADVLTLSGITDVDAEYTTLDSTGWVDVSAVSASTTDYNADDTLSVLETIQAILADTDKLFQADSENVVGFVNQVVEAATTHAEMAQKTLYQGHPTISNIVEHLKRELGRVPPSGAIAGVYAFVDGARGVWKAPANVSLSAVSGPFLPIDDADQEDLNVDTNAGKSINAVRAFTGLGTLVWGARTLAGNDNEWRYVAVRRFYNMVEESVKKSTAWAVFEPNSAPLWTKVKSMIDNYLIQKWRDGALAGSTPDEAFFVKVGLGLTMTAQDILEGRLNVEIGMAVVRPAEFIILKFSHKLQES